MSKPKYFDMDKFIDSIIEDMKLEKANTLVLKDIREMIAERLADRLITTVFRAFTEREIQLSQQMVKDHPEIDEMDAIMIVAKDVKGLDEEIERQIESLYSELVYDADKIEEAIKIQKAKHAEGAA